MDYKKLEERLSNEYENIKVFEDMSNIIPRIYVACNFKDNFVFVVSEFQDSEIGGEFIKTETQTTEEMWNNFDTDASLLAREELINYIASNSDEFFVLGKDDNRVLH